MSAEVVCVVGPTACGKTKMGVLLAKELNGEVVSCDSMQIYRGMTIGTAAPTREEMEGVPHHMIAVADPRENYSVARYAREAGQCVDDILARGKRPIIVGGTGLYLDALLAGREYASGQAGGAVRAQLERRVAQEGIGPLLDELRAVDPESAQRLNPNDQKRIIRALEVYRETGKTITQHNLDSQRVPPRYDAVYLGFAFEDRQDMRDRIDARVEQMAEQGLLDEVRALLKRGVPRGSTALQAIGYKECLSFLDGQSTEEEALELIKLRSRQYAKRQLTWLRRNQDIHWFYWKKTRDFQAALAFSTEILRQRGVS
ncbi:MAG: tRNA (adenosine(37)-N6)-dimethylallyltransferase MiaA [Oscillospiraceae bacterium]|nr:tRNA (adenosine(37)-N6)-dimethylallyltransferase MiaA [Oscillospiraceae bacterium]